MSLSGDTLQGQIWTAPVSETQVVVDIIKQDKQTNMVTEEIITIIPLISLELLFVCNDRNKIRKGTRFVFGVCFFFFSKCVLIFTEKTLQIRERPLNLFCFIFSFFLWISVQ